MSTYIVKNTNPLPKGLFKLKHHEREMFIGKAAQLYAEDSDKYIVPVKSSIMFQSEADSMGDDEAWTKIGHIEGCVVLRGLIIESGLAEEYWRICDDHSRELSDIMGQLFNEEGDHRNQNLMEWDQGDRMVINEVYLEPQWRGYGIGLLAVRSLIDTMPSFNGDLVIVDPAPMTRANGQSGCYPERPLGATLASLRKHWSLLGFQKTSRKESVNYMELWTGYVQPQIRKVVPHLF